MPQFSARTATAALALLAVLGRARGLVEQQHVVVTGNRHMETGGACATACTSMAVAPADIIFDPMATQVRRGCAPGGEGGAFLCMMSR